MIFKNVRDGFIFGKPGRIVERTNEKRLDSGAIGLFLDGKTDGVTLRLLQNEMGDLEQRIGATGDFDLPRDMLNAFFIGDKCDVDFRQRSGCFIALRFAAVIAVILITTAKIFLVTGFSWRTGAGNHRDFRKICREVCRAVTRGARADRPRCR